MAVRALNHSVTAHLEDLFYLAARLKSDSQAAALAPNVVAATAALKAQYEVWRSRREQANESRSGLKIAAEETANAVRAAHQAVREDVHYRRRAPKFLTYFPRGLVAVTRSCYPDLLVAVRAIARRCAEDPSPKVQEQAPLLQAAAEKLQAAIGRRSEALVAEAAAYGQLQAKKIGAVITCRQVGNRLGELYPHEADRVRSFFRVCSRRPRSTEPAVEEPPPVAETAPVVAALAAKAA